MVARNIINNQEKELMPREKLKAQGVEALEIFELLAIILTTGYKGESVLELSKRLLREYGSVGLKDIRNYEQLKAETSLPEVKTLQLIACFELGQRLNQHPKKGEQNPTIHCPKDVYEHLIDMRKLRKEQLRGLYLNTRNKIIHQETISIGTITANLVQPSEVFKPAIEYGAVKLIICHNHPSGDPTPSQEDIAVTAQIVKGGKILGISLIDHIIIAEEGFYSLKESGDM